MAQGDGSSGLLSKVAKFVTNPTKDWSELDKKEPEQDSGYSKEALKEMIERKRQNDFVRKREFDHLRKLRRREPVAAADRAGRPSFFQSSLTSNLDERAETLKKIDEIEAQMSHQWWKGKKEDGAALTAPGAVQPMTVPMTMPSAQVEPGASSHGADGFESTEASEMRSGSSSRWKDSPQDYAPTAPPPHGQQSDRAVPRHQQATQPMSLPPQSPHLPVGAGFSTNRLFAVELADGLTDPDLEEAAIRFANGDNAGAEESLLGALKGADLQPESAEAWMSALFDLYRATGQQDRFENVALEFASRFGRSAPAWFSTPELLNRQPQQAAKAGKPAASASSPVWHCPAELTVKALAELQAIVTRSGAAGPVQLDWSALVVITPEVLPGLGDLFASLCAAPLQLVFSGYASLERALKFITPSGDKSSSPSSWQLRMNALRVMRLQDEFELVALDYCVTFEVSPPSWQDAKCKCVLEGVDMASSAADLDDPVSRWHDSRPMGSSMAELDGEPPALVELTGEIVGDAADALAKLEAGMEGATRMVISCARLIRVDFSAAGSILNWVAMQENKGCKVQFREVNRIVAAFFNVIGINEHAKVVPRSA